MAVLISRPTLLEFTAPSGVSISSLDLLTEASFNDAVAMEETMTGNSRYPYRFPGRRDATITVSSLDFDKYDDFTVGGVFTDIVLTAEAGDCNTSGSELTVTMSKGQLTEKGEVSLSADSFAAANYSVTFALYKGCDDVSDPTFTVATA